MTTASGFELTGQHQASQASCARAFYRRHSTPSPVITETRIARSGSPPPRGPSPAASPTRLLLFESAIGFSSRPELPAPRTTPASRLTKAAAIFLL